ncbi:hypothetical protein [Desulfosarcina variabilis]|uniref:hypothetical protein n=1 Tax=Desulfosarcina variabilis TaxID=2300 RepID=UPI003AFB5A06
MPSNYKRIMARVDWIKNQLRAGRHWNASILAAEFGISGKTAQRTINDFKKTYPDWDIRYDPQEKTIYLENSLPIRPADRRPGRLQMSGKEFAEIRKSLTLTHDQLADCTYHCASLIAKWESEEKQIPTDMILLMRAWDRARWFGLWRGRQRRIYRRQGKERSE